jgi:predicted DNA-binding protein
MPKKLSLEISDEIYKDLRQLANRLGQDEKQVATTILEAISRSDNSIEWLSKMPCADPALRSVLCDALENYPIFARVARNFS